MNKQLDKIIENQKKEISLLAEIAYYLSAESLRNSSK